MRKSPGVLGSRAALVWHHHWQLGGKGDHAAALCRCARSMAVRFIALQTRPFQGAGLAPEAGSSSACRAPATGALCPCARARAPRQTGARRQGRLGSARGAGLQGGGVQRRAARAHGRAAQRAARVHGHLQRRARARALLGAQVHRQRRAHLPLALGVSLRSVRQSHPSPLPLLRPASVPPATRVVSNLTLLSSACACRASAVWLRSIVDP